MTRLEIATQILIKLIPDGEQLTDTIDDTNVSRRVSTALVLASALMYADARMDDAAPEVEGE